MMADQADQESHDYAGLETIVGDFKTVYASSQLMIVVIFKTLFVIQCNIFYFCDVLILIIQGKINILLTFILINGAY